METDMETETETEMGRDETGRDETKRDWTGWIVEQVGISRILPDLCRALALVWAQGSDPYRLVPISLRPAAGVRLPNLARVPTSRDLLL